MDWVIWINGYECASPNTIKTYIHQSAPFHSVNLPLVIEGICEKTSQGALAKGDHDIALVSQLPHSPDGLETLTMFQTRSFFQVQELCK